MYAIIRRAGLLPLCCLALCAQTTGALHGRITDPKGSPLSGATAIATRTGGGAGSTYTAASSSSGDFQLTGLRPGSYTICFQAPAGDYLNSCHWSAPLRATVAAGRDADTGVTALVQGVRLSVRVNDPAQRLTAAAGRPAPDLFLSVMTPRLIVRELRLASSDAGGRTFEAILPPGTPLNLSVVSRTLELTGAGNAKLASAARIPITLAAGAPAPPLVLTVTGSK